MAIFLLSGMANGSTYKMIPAIFATIGSREAMARRIDPGDLVVHFKQQAAAVPRRQVEIVVGVTKPLRKDLDVKLAYTPDVLPNEQVAIFPKVSGSRLWS